MLAATDVPSLITAIAALITAGATLYAVTQVHKEVKTTNGKTLAKLGELAEGRRIRDDVAEPDRTASDRHYVAGVTDDDDPATP